MNIPHRYTDYAIITLVVIIVLYIISRFPRSIKNQKPWQQGFENLRFSSEAFYQSCERAIRKREIPGISFSRVRYSEGGLTSAKREYLHIVRGDYVYDICAAPFGTGFFVSSWYFEKMLFMEKILFKIPIIKQLLESKTYFQADTDAMFKSFVHTGMLEAIDEMTTSKGVRALTEFERRMPENKK